MGHRPPARRRHRTTDHSDESSGRVNLRERFERSLSHETEAGCWIRNVAPTPRGYTQIRDGNRKPLAHRVAYELYRAEIPEGLVLDHLCRNPACVNPWHLEPVTHRENIFRGVSPQALVVRTGHCQRGHEVLAGRCEACERIRRLTNEARRAKHRAYIREYMRGYRARKRLLNVAVPK